MASKKLVTTQPKTNNPLSQNIHLLGDLLGQVIREQQGQRVFNQVEEIRTLAREWRADDAVEGVSLLAEVCENLALELTVPTLKAFTTYFHLVNLVEEHEQVRVLRLRQLDRHPLADSMAEAIATLKSRGITAEEMQVFLNQLSVEFVLTAHPTESKRRSVLGKLCAISNILGQLDTLRLPPQQHDQVMAELRAQITLLWLTGQVRTHRPTVLDEVQNGLWYFSQTLFNVIPEIYYTLEQALTRSYPGYSFHIPNFLRFGSWIGGDRDGNPNVTAAITAAVFPLQREFARQYFGQALAQLFDEFSLADRYARISATLDRFITEQKARFPHLAATLAERQANEPYRQALAFIAHQLGQPIPPEQQALPPTESTTLAQSSYPNGAEFLADMQRLVGSLQGARETVSLARRLQPLLRQIETFGLHTAALDIRQHSSVHGAAIAELLQHSEALSADYAHLPEADKCKLINQMLETATFPAIAQDCLSPATVEMLDLFNLLQRVHQENPAALGCYLISMAHHPSDMLEVLWLAGRVGLYDPQEGSSGLDIAPLFETIADLEGAPQVLEALLNTPAYRNHLQLRSQRQLIQLGYSDSTKDGGYLTANWALYQGQQAMAAVARSYSVQLTFFHGRGGAIGRGGGPTHRVIKGLPPETMNGRFRLTEQGEVIFDRFGHPAIAQRYLEQVIGAVLQVGAGQADEVKAGWVTVMDTLSASAYQAYRGLIYETPGFIDYFHQATPIDVITELTLGSRPARRTASDRIEDLRAIPWVFAWMQNRHTLPGWYGLGSALAEFMWSNRDGLATLRIMYQQWPFFKAVLDNAQMALLKADMAIAARYARLVTDHELRERIFSQVAAEHALTEQTLLAVCQQKRLLDNEKVLQRAIQLRNPYVDPLSLIQVGLLRRFRALPQQDGSERKMILDALRLGIVGIAAGLKNTG